MSGSFELILDTVGPTISMSAPIYTTPYEDVEVFIDSSEQLSLYQDIYIIDSEGTRHDYIFQNNGDSMYGLMSFREVATGIATIYAQLKDDVGNPSNTEVHHINVLTSYNITIELSDYARELTIKQSERDLITSESIRSLNTENTVRELKMNEDTRLIEIEVKSE